jgi:hypothetical protein
MKNRSPAPVNIGLVWVFPSTKSSDNIYKNGFIVRNAYTDNYYDGVMAYWEFHDGWSSAREIIQDFDANARF